jgi:stage II sporulation protein D
MRLLLPLILLLCFPLTAANADSPRPTILRIGLDHSYRHSTTLLLSSDQSFTLSDPLSNHPVVHGGKSVIYKLTAMPTGIALARVDDLRDAPIADGIAALSALPGRAEFIKIARLDGQPLGSKGIPWHRYRGFLTVRREADSTLRVINTIPLEPYLYGVIPAEIGSHVPMEAMKAQAVAARTYALKNRGKCSIDGFDLDDTTRCEGYYGVDGETALCSASVDDTRGQVMAYHGQLIDAPYSTDSGGVTACDTNGDCPYLCAVRDADPTDGREYADTGKYHIWSQTFTAAQIEALLGKDPRTHVDKFVSLNLDGLDASGRIVRATVTGADGTLHSVTGPQLRQILGYDVLRSTRLTLTRTADGSYRFDGRGWGHGLGMSQDGAVAMAGPHYHKTYLEILRHYYTGITLVSITTLPKSIS